MYSHSDRIKEDKLTAASSTAFLLAVTLLCLFSHQALEVVVRLTVTAGTAVLTVLVPYFGLQFAKRSWQR